MGVIIVCGFLKGVVMFWTLWYQRDETLVTLGDAIASWLDKPDTVTKGDCLMSKADSDTHHYFLKGLAHNLNSLHPIARIRPGIRRWGAAVSVDRWIFAMIFYIITLGSLLGLFFRAVGTTTPSREVFRAAFQKDTFGAVDPVAVVRTELPTAGASGLMSAILVVNSPQLVLSFFYLLYNSLLTSMCLSYEYSTYARRRKSLRVSTPKGTQRATYWLQLPYTYGMPLITASVVLHWLVSQSIFLSRVSSFVDEEGWGEDPPQELTSTGSNIGISVGPIFTTFLFEICMILAIIGISLRKLASRIPLAASCSLAIAAATHRPDDDVDASVLPVMWGEVLREGSEVVGHCCFTSEDVVDLVEGRKYAGAHKELRAEDLVSQREK